MMIRPEPNLGLRGRWLRSLTLALVHWESAIGNIGRTEQLGVTTKKVRQARTLLSILVDLVGTHVGQTVIVTFARDVNALISGTHQEVTFLAGDHLFEFLTKPVVNPEQSLALALRVNPVRTLELTEVAFQMVPGDVDCFYQLVIA